MRDHTRDYCTAAFRFYACICKDIIECQDETDSKDIVAAEKALDELERKCGRHAIQAVKIVYFTDCDKALRKGDIDMRVHKASINIPASESTIYRWLQQARYIFAKHRKLRL